MPTERPALKPLIDQGAAEFESRLPGVLVRLRVSVIGVINRVVAGGLSALYKYAEQLNKNVWPDICDQEELPKHGARWGKPQREAEFSTGDAHFTGVDTSPIAVGTVVQRSDEVQYETTVAGVIAAGVATVPVRALVAGQDGNALIGTALNLTSSVPGINAAVVAATALAGGADVEDPEAWRARILERIRNPPQGGADYDYEDWALSVPGVTRAWTYPHEQGSGTVVVRFVREDDAFPIPDAGEVAAVQAAIDAKRPTTAHTYVVAPIAVPQAFTIQVTPNTSEVKVAIEAELRELYRNEAVPGGTMLLSHQREAISIAAGETDHVMTVPSANQTHTTGQFPTFGGITWLP
ncbi:MAG: baseplate J/gp47 family protein [Burkholderiaceae bacterium]|nr:baseplate J/gp47 family protein [Burkholderiaceae bacterium]